MGGEEKGPHSTGLMRSASLKSIAVRVIVSPCFAWSLSCSSPSSLLLCSSLGL